MQECNLESILSVLQIRGTEEDEEQDTAQVLRKLNNIDFKLEMHTQSCIDNLTETTTQALSVLE